MTSLYLNSLHTVSTPPFSAFHCFVIKTSFMISSHSCRTSFQSTCSTCRASPTFVSRTEDASLFTSARSTLSSWLTVKVRVIQVFSRVLLWDRSQCFSSGCPGSVVGGIVFIHLLLSALNVSEEVLLA